MLISEFIEQLKNFDGNKSIAVKIDYPISIAYSPNSPIKSLFQGFDWDSNMVFIVTEHNLETIPSDRKRIYESEIKRNIEDIEVNHDDFRVGKLISKQSEIISELGKRDYTNISIMQLKEIEDILNQTK